MNYRKHHYSIDTLEPGPLLEYVTALQLLTNSLAMVLLARRQAAQAVAAYIREQGGAVRRAGFVWGSVLYGHIHMSMGCLRGWFRAPFFYTSNLD